MNKKYVISIAIFTVVGLWLLSGLVKDEESQESASALSNDATAKPIPLVRAVQSIASDRRVELVVRGRTEENRQVQVRAEASGRIVNLPIKEGASVDTGDILCEIAIDARDQSLIEAQAVQQQAELEYRGVRDLGKRGLQAETNIAQAKAKLESANAALSRAKLQLEHTKVKSPFSGVLENQPVELGDFMLIGDVCALVLDADPILLVGQVAEKEIAFVTLGDTVSAELITGEKLTGNIRFIARTADKATRSYRVEVEVPNPELKVRAGITAEIRLPLAEQKAHAISPAILVLNDAGRMGVKVVNDNNIVEFVAIQIIEEGSEGVWISGLADEVKIITVGQEVVFAGDEVEIDLTPLERL